MTDDLQPIHQIPVFKSREEEAAYWDSHDIADLVQQGEQVRIKFVPKNRLLSLRLDVGSIAQLQLQAQKRGLKTTTLARMWLLEKLEQLSSNRKPLGKSW